MLWPLSISSIDNIFFILIKTQNIVFNITNNFKQPKGESSALDTTCWEKWVISPLKQNTNRATRKIIFNTITKEKTT